MVALVGLESLTHIVLSGTPLHRKTNKTQEDLQHKITKGHSLMQYIRAAAKANMHTTLRDLRETGFSARELVEVYNYSISQLRGAGYSASELLSSGISQYKLEAAGIAAPTPGQPIAPPPPPAPVPPPPPPPPPPPEEKPLTTQEVILVKMQKAGLDAKKLDMAGFSQDELRDIVGLNNGQLKTLGYTPAAKTPDFSAKPKPEARQNFALKAQSTQAFSAAQLKALGYSATELKAAGFSLNQLKEAGFSAQDLRQAQFHPNDLRAAGYSGHHLLRAGFSSVDLLSAGYSNADILNAVTRIQARSLDINRAIRAGALTNPAVVGTANAARAATLSSNPVAHTATAESTMPSNLSRYDASKFSVAEDPQAYSNEATTSSMNESMSMDPY